MLRRQPRRVPQGSEKLAWALRTGREPQSPASQASDDFTFGGDRRCFPSALFSAALLLVGKLVHIYQMYQIYSCQTNFLFKMHSYQLLCCPVSC